MAERFSLRKLSSIFRAASEGGLIKIILKYDRHVGVVIC